MSYIAETLGNLLHQTAFFNLTWGNYVMILVACVFLIPGYCKRDMSRFCWFRSAFGMLLVNIYPDIMAFL